MSERVSAVGLLRSATDDVRLRRRRRHDALVARMQAVLGALDDPAASRTSTSDLRAAVAAHLAEGDASVFWLVIAVLTAELPYPEQVKRLVRIAEFDGVPAALDDVIDSAKPNRSSVRGLWSDVQVARGRTLVDLHHTARTELATGIQRVARQSVRRWREDHDLTLVGWSYAFSTIRELTVAQTATAVFGEKKIADSGQDEQPAIVPWESTYLLPELMTERPRALRLQALVSYSRSHSAAIGFDCVPLSSAETTADGMGGAFSVNLTALARMDRIATISEAAAVEYRGWRTMLSGAGLTGPAIEVVSLAVEASRPTEQGLREVRDRMRVATMPLVLVVGSHEPRKNHLAVLQAAELLWRDGLRFSLTFIGGNAWNSERFSDRLGELQGVRRPVQSISAISDDVLWAAYASARFTMFPSLNEGFGLPVAESLASGTPVITSGFGSMLEIAGDGGALLIDPRDDLAIAEAMRTLLNDDDVHARLVDESANVVLKSWDTYARQVWEALMPDSARQAATEVAVATDGVFGAEHEALRVGGADA